MKKIEWTKWSAVAEILSATANLMKDLAALTDLEKIQLHPVMTQCMRSRESRYLPIMNGAFDAETFESFSNPTLRMLALRTPRIWRENNSRTPHQEFVDFVNERLGEIPIQDMNPADFTGLR